jgi:hypothetical protein
MIQYTDALTAVIEDVVARVEQLSFIDISGLLVFARFGRSGAQGAYATCHCLNLPTSDPGYYYWRDRGTGELTRRTEWFVTRTPEVRVGSRTLDYLLSFSLPRFCDQSLKGARKAAYYRGCEPWVAKLDTIVHELYHIAPFDTGLRKFERRDGTASSAAHGPAFLEEVAMFVRTYLDTKPDPRRLEFLRYDFRELVRRYGGVAGTTFRNFPSYPQRYAEAVQPQPALPDVAIERIPRSCQPHRYSDLDLQLRAFSERGSRRALPTELHTAA